jgi:hypothetical protein
MVREACRAGTALDKALGEAVREALTAGHTWPEIGQALTEPPRDVWRPHLFGRMKSYGTSLEVSAGAA